MKLYDEILNLEHAGVDVVIKSTLSLTLLKIYSILFMNGAAPRACERAQRQYYKKLTQEGKKMAKDIDNRTCVPAWKGLRYVKKMATHILDTKITDEQACYALYLGALRPSDFIKLPDNYDKYKASKDSEIKKVVNSRPEKVVNSANNIIFEVLTAQGNLSRLNLLAMLKCCEILGIETDEDPKRSEVIELLTNFLESYKA